MSKSTQGPWIYEKPKREPYDKAINFEISAPINSYRDYEIGIADVYEEANARLIAAAPDLLQALINALPNLHTGDELPMSYYADKKGVLGEALRAIAKAKGENK